MASSSDDAGSLRDHSTDDRIDTSSEDARTISDRSDRSDSSAECRWKTDEFHSQECSRYFDCPTHTIPRRLSMERDRESTGSPHTEENTQESTADAPTSRDSSRPESLSSERETSNESTPELPQQLNTDNWDARQGAAGPSGTTAAEDQDANTESSWSFATPQSSADSTIRAMASSGYGTARPPVPSFEAPLPASPPSGSQRRLSETPPSYHGHALPPIPRQRGHGASRRSSEAGLPRWVPDAEVTYCPICQTQFSFFVRKHHCR